VVDLRPFRGLRFDQAKVGPIGPLLAPPFDVIANNVRQELLSRSPYNVVHLTLAGEVGGDWHQAAAERFQAWRKEGVLRQDEQPSFYAYEHQFEWKGIAARRLGLIGILRLEEENRQEVFPHEHTFPKARRDRLKLLSACRANLEPIFLVFPDPELQAAQVVRKEEGVDVVETSGNDGTTQTFWRVTDPETIRRIRDLFSSKKLLVADGHHRFATAKDYRDAKWGDTDSRDREAPYNFRMVQLSSIEDPALRILPTHRTVREVPSDAIEAVAEELGSLYEFRVEDGEPGKLAESLVETDRSDPQILMYTARHTWSLYPRSGDAVEAAMGKDRSTLWCSLPASRLHRLILEGVLDIKGERLAECVEFHRSPADAVARVDQGQAQAAFFLRSVEPRVVWELAQRGEMMPQKSTDFFPKFPSGYVFYTFDEFGDGG
jgi:uncharacterized protein (DUF1015 family)